MKTFFETVGNLKNAGHLHGFRIKMVNDEVEWKKCPLMLTKDLEKNRLKLLEALPDSDGPGIAI